MELVDSHQNHLKVMNVQTVKGIKTTYNLTVLDNHTFYVGEDKVWVHNAGKSCDCSLLFDGFNGNFTFKFSIVTLTNFCH